MEFKHEGTNSNVKVSPSNVPTPNPLMQTAQGLTQGQIPHNNQLQQTIQSTQVALDEAKYATPLSAKGQVLIDDAKDLLASASRMIQEKNSDEKFQRLMNDTAHAGSATRGNLSGVSLPTTGSGMTRGHASSILNNGRSIGMFAVRSGQFRDILVQLLDIFQSVLKTAQDKVAQQPSGNVGVGGIASQLRHEQVVPQHQKDALWDRFVSLLSQLGSRPEYSTGVDHLFQIMDHMVEKGRMMQTQTGGASALPTSEYDRVWQDLKIVFEEFAGVGTMDELERRNWLLFNAMKQDPEARMWLQSFRQFIMETVRNPAVLNDQSRSAYGRQLFDQGRFLIQGKYRPFFSDIFDQLRLVLTNIKNDSVTTDFNAKLAKFGADFAFDASGKPDLFVIQESLSQMRQIIIPVLSKQLANLPIPKIEGSNPKYDFGIEGLLLNVGDLLPEFINFHTKSDTKMSVQRLSTQKRSVRIVMEVDRIRALFKDIRFFYRRKRMPRIEDHGIADVDLSQGTGVSLRIVWKLKSSPNQPFLVRLLNVKCNIDRLAITVRNAKHNIIDKLATKLFAGTIKKQVANAIVNNIIHALQPMSVRLNDLFKTHPVHGVMERANDGLKTSVFTGQPGLLSKAKDAIVSGTHNLTQPSTTTPSMTTPMMTPPVSTIPVTSSSLPITSEMENLTFIEKPKKGQWAFEWYNPSPHDTPIEGGSSLSDKSENPVQSGEQRPFVSI